MQTFEGHKVKNGVHWKVTKDCVSITCYPSRRSYIDGRKTSYKLYKNNNWKNECPYCKKKGWKWQGILGCHGNGYITTTKGKRRWKTGVEGQVHCCQCDMDCCGVTGKELSTKSKGKLLTEYKNPAPNPTPDPAIDNNISVDERKKNINNIKAEYKKRSLPQQKIKLTIPPLPINAGQYLQVSPNVVKKSAILFVDGVDITARDMKLNLSTDIPSRGEYKPPKPDPNPPKPDPDPPKPPGNLKPTEKKFWDEGARRKTVKACFDWIKRKSKGGKNFDYIYYKNTNGACTSNFPWCEKQMKKFWDSRKGNCLAFSQGLYTMVKGANIKGFQLVHGQATTGGKRVGHYWNRDSGGNIHDASCGCTNHKQDRIERKGL